MRFLSRLVYFRLKLWLFLFCFSFMKLTILRKMRRVKNKSQNKNGGRMIYYSIPYQCVYSHFLTFPHKLQSAKPLFE